MWKTCVELYKKYRELVNYLIVGVLTTVVSLGIYYGCVWTFLDPGDAFQLQAANILSWIGAVAFAYVTNRRYVFESENAGNYVFSKLFVFRKAKERRD